MSLPPLKLDDLATLIANVDAELDDFAARAGGTRHHVILAQANLRLARTDLLSAAAIVSAPPFRDAHAALQ